MLEYDLACVILAVYLPGRRCRAWFYVGSGRCYGHPSQGSKAAINTIREKGALLLLLQLMDSYTRHRGT